MESLSEYVDVGRIEKVGINIRSSTGDEMSAADGEDLAQCVGSMQNTILIGIGCPYRVILLDTLNNDDLIGNTFARHTIASIDA